LKLEISRKYINDSYDTIVCNSSLSLKFCHCHHQTDVYLPGYNENRTKVLKCQFLSRYQYIQLDNVAFSYR